MMKGKICIVTGTRAEYGLLRPLIKAISEHSSLELQLVATGMHLLSEFGDTYKEIEQDGFKIDLKVDNGLRSDTSKSISKSIGVGIIGFADAFEELEPDLLVILGDRTEILSACICAMIKGLPIAHIHGGETTEGAYDESIRHAISKMSYLHFTANEAYRKRVIQLGESPDRVFNVGAIGIDSINELKLLSKEELEDSMGFRLGKENILITFHPVTLENDTAGSQFQELIFALEKQLESHFIFTYPNSDKDGRIILKMIEEFVAAHPNNSIGIQSLGQLRYLSALQFVDMVVGNSSSGIIEVPFFDKPTINIGERQKGRIMPESVINCEPTLKAIVDAFQLAKNPEFSRKIKNQQQVYGKGGATKQIIDVLETIEIRDIKKPFYDLV